MKHLPAYKTKNHESTTSSIITHTLILQDYHHESLATSSAYTGTKHQHKPTIQPLQPILRVIQCINYFLNNLVVIY